LLAKISDKSKQKANYFCPFLISCYVCFAQVNNSLTLAIKSALWSLEKGVPSVKAVKAVNAVNAVKE
jgi:hypothetical protein